jgi:hypothetical protein
MEEVSEVAIVLSDSGHLPVPYALGVTSSSMGVSIVADFCAILIRLRSLVDFCYAES